MKLSGITGEPGTVIGYHIRELKFLAIEINDIEIGNSGGCHIRFATSEEIDGNWVEPRSVAEHYAIPLRYTPYGHARMFGPTPYIKPPIVHRPSILEQRKATKRAKLVVRRWRQWNKP